MKTNISAKWSSVIQSAHVILTDTSKSIKQKKIGMNEMNVKDNVVSEG